MPSTFPLLETTHTWLKQCIGPQANRLDSSAADLFAAFRQLADYGLHILRLPSCWGGLEVTDCQFRQLQEQFARYSGALAFLQAQHHSAVALLSRSPNEALKRVYLPQIAAAKVALGISFSHLRRSPPPLQAVPVSDGYVLNGQAPWVTGWGCFQHFIVAACLPDRHLVYGLVPFHHQSQSSGELRCSEPMALAALMATNTVAVEFCDWRLPTHQVVDLRPWESLAAGDRQNVLHHSFYALGCAQAGLDILQAPQPTSRTGLIHPVAAQLSTELADCRAAIYSALNGEAADLSHQKLRAWAIDLANRCAQAAVIASAGAANNLQHPAQRVVREAMVFSVTGQTQPVMAASLERLLLRGYRLPAIEENASLNSPNLNPTAGEEQKIMPWGSLPLPTGRLNGSR